MIGSEKQIKWAEEIKKQAIAAALKPYAILAAAEIIYNAYESAEIADAHFILDHEISDEEAARLVNAAADTHAEAKWWIEHRPEIDLAKDVAAKFFN